MADQKLIDATRAAGDISMTTDGMAGSWAGLPVFVSGSLAATFGYLATRRAIDARVTEPVRLTANAIGALNVELAVVGEGLFDADYPNEIMELAPTIPVGDRRELEEERLVSVPPDWLTPEDVAAYLDLPAASVEPTTTSRSRPPP